MKLFNLKPIAQPYNRKRVRLKFAYLPVRLDNGAVIWLEDYIAVQHYRFFKREWVTYAKRPVSKKALKALDRGWQYRITYVNKAGEVVKP